MEARYAKPAVTKLILDSECEEYYLTLSSSGTAQKRAAP